MFRRRRGRLRGFLAVLALGLLVLGLSYLAWLVGSAPQGGDTSHFKGLRVQVYYSPTCECCEAYVEYLRGHGFSVEPITRQDMDVVKQSLVVPRALWSCHTSVLDGYFVEGHVPIAFIERLLQERPSIQGIALPGMPQGSPGMGGHKMETFIIYSVSQGSIQEFGRM